MNKKGRPTDLYHKRSKVKGVVVHHDSPDVANDGVHDADEHAAHEPPLLPAKAEVRMNGGSECVQRNEGDVCSKRGAITVDGVLHGAEIEGAVGLGSEIYHVWR